MKNIWDYNDSENSELSKSPEQILNEYAKELNEYQKDFVAVVTESRSESHNEVYYAFYIIAPKLKDYMYRLFEIKTPSLISFYPLELTHFAKDPRNVRTYVSNSEKEFDDTLKELIKSPLTKMIMRYLKTLSDTVDDYNKE